MEEEEAISTCIFSMYHSTLALSPSLNIIINQNSLDTFMNNIQTWQYSIF